MDDLIIRAKSGDKEAFTKLVLESKKELYKVARAKLSNMADIEDAIQETTIKAYLKIKSLKDNSKFKFWLFKILINECNKIYRKRKVQEVSIESIENSISSENASEKEYNELLNALKDDEKILVILFYSNGYTTKEISKILNKNENTIKTKLRRIREKLKEKLKSREEGNLYG